jgi:hypothetical protein
MKGEMQVSAEPGPAQIATTITQPKALNERVSFVRFMILLLHFLETGQDDGTLFPFFPEDHASTAELTFS